MNFKDSRDNTPSKFHRSYLFNCIDFCFGCQEVITSTFVLFVFVSAKTFDTIIFALVSFTITSAKTLIVSPADGEGEGLEDKLDDALELSELLGEADRLSDELGEDEVELEIDELGDVLADSLDEGD